MRQSSSMVVSTNPNIGVNAQLGSNFSLSTNDKSKLYASFPNISITSAVINSSGNTTSLAIRIQNNGDTNAIINNIAVYGPMNLTTQAGIPSNLSSSTILGQKRIINATLAAKLGLDPSAYYNMYFTTDDSGDLSEATQVRVSGPNKGVTLSPGTFVYMKSIPPKYFPGEVSYDSGLVIATLQPGQHYSIVVSGNAGSYASINTIATTP